MLQIKDLKASIGESEILRGLSLDVSAGEVHAIMGPNGSGKSTLAQVIAGHDDYEVTAGSVTYKGMDLLELGDSLPDFFPQAIAVSHIVQDFSPKAPAAGFTRSAHTSRY